ncbi:MAG: HYR domain-containing protein [Saprospiraceae bacterium]
MRISILLCLWLALQWQAAAAVVNPPVSGNPASAMALSIDSLHQINCLRTSGYLSVLATGGVPGYTYAWSNGHTGPIAEDLPEGEYQITATDSEGNTTELNVEITSDQVYPSAYAGADASVNCSNTTYTLNGSGSAGQDFQYQWAASNGGAIQSGANTLNPVIQHTGTFTLFITNVVNGCSSSDAVLINALHTAPVVSASGNTITCIQNTATLNASFNTANTVYGWTGPNGFNSALLSPVVSIPGSYIITVSDTLSNCSTAVVAAVPIDTIRPLVSASVSGIITCVQPQVTLNGAGIPASVNYQWAGPNGFNSTLQSPQTGSAGTYLLVVTNPQNGCTRSVSQSVSANTTPPTATATASGSISCVVLAVTVSGSSNAPGASYSWTGPGGFSALTQNITANTPGTYTLTVKNPVNGCTAVATASVNANTTAPGASATGGLKTCANPTVTLHATSNTNGVNYYWSGPGNFSSNQASPVASQAGTYFVTVTNPANGCTSMAQANVTQNITPPMSSAGGATITCTTPNPKLIATSSVPGSSFFWSGPNGFTANIANPAVTIGGSYNVTVTSPVNGCTSAANAYVYENNIPPFVYAGEDRSLNCIFSSIIMNPIGTTSGSNFTYLWTTFDGNIVSGANSLYARADAAGTYTLTVKNNQNGCMAMDSMDIVQSPPVTAAITQLIPASCYGDANGSAKAVPGGGNGSYSYNWSNGKQTALVAGLAAGTYSVTVTDSESCSATATAVVTQPNELLANVVATPQTMYGLNNGTANAIPSGGTPGYTFKWSNGKTTQTINNLAPGQYMVTLTDSKGCSLVKTATVNAVSCNLAGSLATTQITCAGVNNGSITTTITGANMPVSYLWSNGSGNSNLTGLAAGTYTLTATDAAGCSTVLNTQITSPQAMSVAIASQVNVMCQGAQTGALTLNITGGTTPYQYAWSNGNQSAMASNLGVGAYSCTVSDNKGCTKVQNAQIIATDNQPPVLSLKNATVAIDANGAAVLNAAMFDNGSVDAGCGIANWTITPPAFYCDQIGTHVVTLKASDQNGNSATGTATVVVSDNTMPTLICPLNQTVSACASAVQFGQPQIIDNCIAVNAPIQITGLPSGSIFPAGTTMQTFSYTDPGGNTSTCSFSITVTGGLSFELFSTPASCAGVCNGTATVTVAGGQAATYHWSNGQNGFKATGLCPGAYSVTVTDAVGCSLTQSITIVAAATPPISVNATITPVGCAGACDGAVQLDVTGINLPVNVLWSNGASGNALDGLCPGDYAATLTDAAGCTQTQFAQIIVQDIQAPVLNCQNNISTGFCNATVSFSPPQITDNCTINLQQLQLISGLPSGSVFPIGTTVQTYRYTDNAGNTGQCSFTVTVHAPATLSLAATNASCAGQCDGLAAISVSGGQGPFSVQWSNGASGINAGNLCAGFYSATITDGSGCQQFQSANINQPQALGINVNQVVDNGSSAGTGGIMVTVAGGTAPYTYFWTLNGQPFATTEDLGGLYAGQYSLVVTDAKGCTTAIAPLTVQGLVGATEPGADAGWSLYPNPATSEVFLDLSSLPSGALTVQVFDLSGRLLHQQALDSAGSEPLHVDLAGMPNGSLIFRVVQARGVSMKTLIHQQH